MQTSVYFRVGRTLANAAQGSDQIPFRPIILDFGRKINLLDKNQPKALKKENHGLVSITLYLMK
jgi:hypothetical protein